VEVNAFAKINLFLAVTGKRDDGYHELVSVMQSVGLCDTLQISMRDLHGRVQDPPLRNIPQITLETNNTSLPTGDDNLIIKAVKLIMHEYSIPCPIHIKLEKRIPMGAGLGGGSSNAAATLHGLNQLFQLDIPLQTLLKMGETLGADVPFCIIGGSALAEGIGEILSPLPPHPPCHIVLACPNIHISTAATFGKLKAFAPPPVENFLQTYETQDISQIASAFFNTFTPITAALHPIISTLITDLHTHGALGASMTGTGSTVFGYFLSENDAHRACDILKKIHLNTTFFTTKVQGGVVSHGKR